MSTIVLYPILAFVAGFVIAWFIRTMALVSLRKLQKSTDGFLTSERLMKETLRNESQLAHQQKQVLELEFTKKLAEARSVIKQMDQDILLLQKSNEETEALLQAGNPEIHDLKLKLIEANNTIVRLKAQMGESGKKL